MNEHAPFVVKEANDSTGFLMWQVTTLWQRRIAAVLRPHKLTQVQFALLASLLWLSKSENCITQAMIAREAKLDIMMTSQVLRALEAKGLVERRDHPSDTRAKMLYLTKQGYNCILAAVPDVEKEDADFFSLIDAKRTQFNKLLRTLIPSSISGTKLKDQTNKF